MEQGDLDQAVACYHRRWPSIRTRPRPLTTWACALARQGKLDEALTQFPAQSLCVPTWPAHYNVGTALKDLGQLNRSAAQFRQLLARQPSYADAHNNLGILQAKQGKFDEALASYRQGPGPPAGLRRSRITIGRISRPFAAGDADLAALEALAADPATLPPSKMVYIHFALGKALEDVGDYRRAFEHLLQGNALKRREVDYDEAACQRTCRLIAELFDASLFDRFCRRGRSLAGADLRARHAPLRQHARRADSGQPSPGPRRRRTEESGSLWSGGRRSAGRPVPFPHCVR